MGDDTTAPIRGGRLKHRTQFATSAEWKAYRRGYDAGYSKGRYGRNPDQLSDTSRVLPPTAPRVTAAFHDWLMLRIALVDAEILHHSRCSDYPTPDGTIRVTDPHRPDAEVTALPDLPRRGKPTVTPEARS